MDVEYSGALYSDWERDPAVSNGLARAVYRWKVSLIIYVLRQYLIALRHILSHVVERQKYRAHRCLKTPRTIGRFEGLPVHNPPA